MVWDPSAPPCSTIIVFGAAILMTFISSLINRLLLPIAKIKRYSQEISKWKKALQRARETGDEKLMIKVKRRQKLIERMQREQASLQLRPLLVYFIPFLIMFYYLSSFYSFPLGPVVSPSIVAVLPFSVTDVPGFPPGTFGGYVSPLLTDVSAVYPLLLVLWPRVYLMQLIPELSRLQALLNLLKLTIGLNVDLPFLPVVDGWAPLPGFGLWFIWWYFMTSVAFGSLFQRLFGLRIQQ